jgi:galactitol-specific phosphotransferase system IIC component
MHLAAGLRFGGEMVLFVTAQRIIVTSHGELLFQVLVAFIYLPIKIWTAQMKIAVAE